MMKAAIISSSTGLHPDKLFIPLNFIQICAVPEQRHLKRRERICFPEQ